MNNELSKIKFFGQSIWLDSISRQMVRSGELQEKVDDGITGVTSNPSIFQKALASENIYDQSIKDIFDSGEKNPKKIFQAISIKDISDACNVLLPTFNNSNGTDGFVSIEIDPKLANDTEASIEEGRYLSQSINKPNVMIKVPGTEAGFPVIEHLIGSGINVNVTLLFSRNMYRKAAQAYIKGLRYISKTNPEKIKSVSSVASFFISRIDTAADSIITDELSANRGKVAIANAVLAYQDYKEIFSDEDFLYLENLGANKQKLLWASTSAKNPSYDELIYVKNLIGKDTVNTLPEATLATIKDNSNKYENKIESKLQSYKKVMNDVDGVLNIDDITTTLLDDGVRLFRESFDSLLEEIDSKTSNY